MLSLIRNLSLAVFSRILLRGALISTVVFCLFVWSGDAFFTNFLQVSFAAFQIFGGLIFAIFGLRFVFHGADSVLEMRGPPEHLAGAVAMPFMIGPGTVSASVLIGFRLPMVEALLAIVTAMTIVVVTLVIFKVLHDSVSLRNARLVDRYVEIMGKISGLIIGTIAVEMILRGLGEWLKQIL